MANDDRREEKKAAIGGIEIRNVSVAASVAVNGGACYALPANRFE